MPHMLYTAQHMFSSACRRTGRSLYYYLGPRKWAGGQVLRRSGPLSYDVKVGDQIYSRHAYQLLQNRTGHHDLSATLQEQLLDIYPPLRQSESQDICKPGAKFRISYQTSEGGKPQGKSEKSTSTTHLKGQHKETLPPTLQRV